MTLGEKLSLIRTMKGFTQEEIAMKLNMSTTGYAKMERGETKLYNPKLKKIAEILGIELKDLFSSDEKNSFIGLFRSHSIQPQYYISSAVELIQKLEKIGIELEAKNKEIQLLNEQIVQLKEIIGLMKANSK